MRELARRVWDGWAAAFDGLASLFSTKPGGEIRSFEETLGRLSTGEMVLPPGWNFHPVPAAPDEPSALHPRCAYCRRSKEGEGSCPGCAAHETVTPRPRRAVRQVGWFTGGRAAGPWIHLDSE